MTNQSPPDPLATFNTQLDAFNAHDLEAFVATYSDDATIFGLGDVALAGRENIRSFYESRFDDSTLRCTVESAVVINDRFVVAHEIVWRGSEGTVTIATFDIVAGHIQRAMLMKA